MHATVVTRRATEQINWCPTPFPAGEATSVMHGNKALAWSGPFQTVTVAKLRRETYHSAVCIVAHEMVKTRMDTDAH